MLFPQTLDVILTKRDDVEEYHVDLNKRTILILCIVFEFKLATAGHISRFLSKRDQSKYLYLKLRRLWQAGLLESFKVFQGVRYGMPVYYVLSKKGLTILQEQQIYPKERFKNYPRAVELLSWSLFKHEAQIIELASQEAKLQSPHVMLSFRGEASSLNRQYLSDKHVETLTPDYIVFYKPKNPRILKQCVYTEFERTNKSKEAMLNKIRRYKLRLKSNELPTTTIRIIFQSKQMEDSFWTTMTTEMVLQNLRIVTTNISLLTDHKQFLEPVYANEKTLNIFHEGRLRAEVGKRVKIFGFV